MPRSPRVHGTSMVRASCSFLAHSPLEATNLMPWYPGAPAPHFHWTDIPGSPKTATAKERPLEPPFVQRSGDVLARRRRTAAGGSTMSGVLAESSACSGQERFAGVGVVAMAYVVESSCSDASELAMLSFTAELDCTVRPASVIATPSSFAAAVGNVFVASAMPSGAEASAVVPTLSSDSSFGAAAGNAANGVGSAVAEGTATAGGLCSISLDRRLSSTAANLELT
mmetsp:Transcript_55471/g.110259  ORF Transcript_55471/g.110259 Transcript_55471/m.110259 type:complete len:226 (+) Transcript_55471:231-908(+)